MKKQLLSLLVISTLSFYQKTTAQTLSLVKDLNVGTANGLDQWNNEGIVYNGSLIFPATDGVKGLELYVIKNGQMSLIKDINPGTDGSEPSNFILYNNKVYFTATHPDHGNEIWSTDGTESGTQLAIEAIDGVSPSTGPGLMIAAKNNKLYFSLDGNVYVSDGTTAGTSTIPNVSSVNFNEDYSIVSPNVTTYGQGIAFYSQSGQDITIYKHDGSTLSVMQTLTAQYYTDVFGLAEVSNGLLYSLSDSFYDTYNGLYLISKSDGQTTEVKDATDTRFAVNRVIQFNGQKAIFKGLSGGIYATDGTKAGTVKIADATYTLYQGEKIPYAVFDNQILFRGEEDFFSQLMYLSDGTVAGTSLVGTGSRPYLSNMIQAGNSAYWACGVSNGFKTEIWETDITKKSSTKIYTFTESSTTDHSLMLGVTDSKLYIGSSLKGDGREVYALSIITALNPEEEFIAGLKLCTKGQNTFIISSEKNDEKITINQYDLSGNILSSIETTTNTPFTLAKGQPMSILKVSTNGSAITYKIVE